MPPSTVELPLESKLAFLRQPSSYSEPTYRVEALETHMSWVFLTGQHAYKLKKPVCHGLLDFRTIAARRFFCEEEMRLNRRLAPKIYLGIVPLAIDASGHLRLGDGASVTDWLVKMQRLPAHRMLDYRIRQNSVTDEDARQVAALLAAFYRACQPIALTVEDYLIRLQQEIETSAQTLAAPAYHLPGAEIEALCAAQRSLLQRLHGLLGERVRAGKIVEGHGDLRPEHVCLGPEPVIIDCLEFSRELRIIDAADEVAYLALECERLGAPRFGTLLLHAFDELNGGSAPAVLIEFYQSLRASVRARLAISHLDEEKFRYSAEWRRRALEYLELAERHIERAVA